LPDRPDLSEQKWFIYQGRGGDGKSVTNDVIARRWATITGTPAS
jgi:phage/plasmid-associated DNA primase